MTRHARNGAALFCVLLLLSLSVFACSSKKPEPFDAAAAPEDRTITLINYNVAGLPKIFGNQAEDVGANQRQIGAQLTDRAFDIAAVQEDFGYHGDLIAGLDSEVYPFRTVHSGGVPGGDGLNLYSRYPLYNETRTPWETAYGIIDDGADEMTPKGILYALIEIEDGVYLDFYDIHADAYGDEGSTAAREVQFRQLAALLQSRTVDRPVIVTGDFNTSLHHGNDSGLYENLMVPCGLTDVWIELYNGGVTDDFSTFADTSERWDGIEKVLYRSGGGIALTPLDFTYESLTDGDGASLSDHPAAVCSFAYTLTEDFSPTEEPITVTKRNVFWDAVTKVRYIGLDLWKIFTNFEQFTAYLAPEIEKLKEAESAWFS